MDFKRAIAVVRGVNGEPHEYELDRARTVIARAVCDALGITYASDEAVRLCDWLAAGDYSGLETPESIAAEWREGTGE